MICFWCQGSGRYIEERGGYFIFLQCVPCDGTGKERIIRCRIK